MTIQRVQWTCPICNRRYAIPATAPTPARCPQCERDRARGPSSSETESIARALIPDEEEEAEAEPDDEQVANELSALAAIQLEVAEEAVRGPTVSAPVIRRSRPTSRIFDVLSLVYTVLAGLAVVAAFGGLLFGLRAAFVMELTPLRTMAIFQAIGAFCGGLVAAFVFYSMREIIRLLVDIEENTRPR
jgi:hypothetical protein